MSPTQLAPRLLSYASILEQNTQAQAELTATLPFIRPHLALMPDAHLGMGATVGSVIPTEGAIIPAAVGVDIGCGMNAVLTQFTKDDVERIGNLRALRESIEKAIPLSAGKYNTCIWTTDTEARIDNLLSSALDAGFNPERYAGNWQYQLGSLGSGNHFIELSYDEQDRVWLFLHSGSRGVGNKIAQHHIAVARKLMERYFITLPDKDLAYLVEGTDEFWSYMRELRWAQDFARENRAEMMERVAVCVGEWAGEQVVPQQDPITCHHNYTAREQHFGRNLWVSRKGAIDAHEGVWGLIPGSMGTRSYVVQGKGNVPSLCSAPHGAGREHSRSAARKTFTMDQLNEAMVGIEWSGSDAFLDEIPGAYKPIDVVMQDAADLVTVVHELRQFVNVKGD